MPTGYTAQIECGNVKTGKDFILLCTRAFGVYARFKEEPLTAKLPTVFECDNEYHLKQIEKAKSEYAKICAMSPEEIKIQMIHEHYEHQDACKEMLQKCQAKQELLDRVRREVEAWSVPSDEHQGIKEFALKQLDLGGYSWEIDYYKEQLEHENQFEITDEKIAKRHADMKDDALKNIERAQNNYDAALNDAKARSEFMQTLIESLDKIHV